MMMRRMRRRRRREGGETLTARDEKERRRGAWRRLRRTGRENGGSVCIALLTAESVAASVSLSTSLDQKSIYIFYERRILYSLLFSLQKRGLNDRKQSLIHESWFCLFTLDKYSFHQTSCNGLGICPSFCPEVISIWRKRCFLTSNPSHLQSRSLL